MKIVNYNTKQYPFRQVVVDCLNLQVDNLEKIHANSERYERFTEHTDQQTSFHKNFYSNANSEDSDFTKLYKKFIREEVSKQMGEDIVYQKYPTFRVHLPQNLGVGGWHKDRDYNHGTSEVNFWLPVTETWDTNTIWCESEEDKKDFKPINLKYGQFLIFNGANLTHGNKVNETDSTRVSFDFRVVKKDQFTNSEKSTITNSKKLEVGDYFANYPT
tara:strand:+ start:2913 stop:3560 length:648 start_codon:yes stop_codon:yes gene_type:complete